MTAATVTVVCDLFDGSGAAITHGTAWFAPSVTLTDAADGMFVPQAPVPAEFRSRVSPTVGLLPTDDPSVLPSGWAWGVQFAYIAGNPASYNFFLPAGPASFTAAAGTPCTLGWGTTAALTSLPNGSGVRLSGGSVPSAFGTASTYYVVDSSGTTVSLATSRGGSAIASAGSGSGDLTVVQYNLSALSPVGTAVTMASYMLQPSGTPSAGQVPVATGFGEASAWGSVSTSGGSVSSVFGRTGAVVAQSGDYTAAQVGALPSSGPVPGSLVGLAPSGDETGAADKANIQGLLNIAGRSILQAGHFYIDGALTVHSGDMLAGAGSGSTDTSDYVTLIEQLSTSANGIQGTDVDTLTFSGFALKGPGSGTGIGMSLTWLDFTNTPYTDFANLLVAGFGSHGIAINTTVNCAMRRVVSHANGGDGFHFTGNGTSGSFSACWGTDNGGYGWYVNDCNYYSWNGCGADGNANGWYFTDCESVAINGCGAEANTTDAFTVDASLSVEINGLWLYGNNHYGVHLTSTAYRVKVSGVTESSPGGSAVASIIADAGSICTLENNTLITATALNGTATVLGDGTLSMPGGASASGLTATGAVGGYTQAGRFTGFTYGGAPSGGTFATRDWALDAVNDCLWICTAGGTPGTWVSAGLVAGNNLSDVASRQISLNNLAGAVTSGDYLRGNGANVAMSAIQASDVPQLADYAPTGLTGATAASRYVGATASGAPASGTFAVGDFVIDRTGVFWVCTTAGSPGTWTGAAALALPLTGGTMSGVIAMGSHKITGLTNGSSAQDAAAYGQTPAGGNTVTVPEGGTGGTAMTAYAVLAGGTAATSPLQQVSGLGSSSQVLTSNGGSALPTWQAATGFANPMTTLGDIIYENATPAPARLAGGTTSTKNFLTQTGTGTTSTAPAWGTIAAGDVPTLNQNTSGNAATATNLAGGATFPDYVAPKVVTLTDGTAVALNAALGNSFAWALGGTAHTLSAPSSPVDGQAIKVRIKYGGSYTPLFNSVFDFGTAGAPSWTATSGKTDIAGFEYDAALNSGAGEWAYLGSVLGLKS